MDSKLLTVVLTGTPDAAKSLAQLDLLLARTLSLKLEEARYLRWRLPARLPLHFATEHAAGLVSQLQSLGARAHSEPTSLSKVSACVVHAHLVAERQCERCSMAICCVCWSEARLGLCKDCRRRQARSRKFYRIRVTLLLSILASVLMVAALDYRRRHHRTSWEHPIRVGFVVLTLGPVDQEALAGLRLRTPELADQFNREAARYRGKGFTPFSFEVLGPVEITSAPPQPSTEDALGLLRYTWDWWNYRRPINDKLGVSVDEYDSLIYLVTRRPRDEQKQMIEGSSQFGGWVGSVTVDLNRDMVDFALFVASHELLHALGATDKYNASGRAQIPSGLADPDRSPRYPQIRAEVMARNRVLQPGQERPPDTLAELGVGPATAREIGWLR